MVGGEGGPGPAHMRGCVCVRAPWRAKTQGVASHHLQGTPSGVFLDWADSSRWYFGKELVFAHGPVRGMGRANLVWLGPCWEHGWQARGWPGMVGRGVEGLRSPALLPVSQKPGDFSNELRRV